MIKFSIIAGRFPCDVCQKHYKNYPSLWRHKKHECGQPKSFQCTYCYRYFRQRYDVKVHVRNLHPEMISEFDIHYKNLQSKQFINDFF